ncbi:MAG TPA: hypothetical protein VFC19_54300 [Candidatus Limnocylindrales bacterium]|nr:hypothetical protein [Candidatus Limnocylindrales bacterium]
MEHVHLARASRFTRRQVELLVASRTVILDDVKKLDATRKRVLRLLARAPRRRPAAMKASPAPRRR